jgi:hypothetical protein
MPVRCRRRCRPTGSPATTGQLDAFNHLGNRDTAAVLINNGDHRHFDAGMCAQVQGAGMIAAANQRAILDLETIRLLVIAPLSRRATDFCGFETFTNLTDPSDHSLASNRRCNDGNDERVVPI